MHTTQVLLVGILLSVIWPTARTRVIPESFARSRVKRQFADLTLGQHLMNIGINHTPQGCREIACGLVDIAVSGKKKRSYNVEDVEEDYASSLGDRVHRLRLVDKLIRGML